MDQAAFQEAIVARPDDDTPRLIYADWLEERGDPRGAFVRAQCALERLSADDPRRPALEDEADDLLAAHGEEWAAPLRGVARGWRFRRGFVEHVEADGETFLSRAEAWFAAFPLRDVCLRLPPRLMPDLAACPYLKRVESLAFHGHFLLDRDLRMLLASPHLDRLTALDLRGHGIETAGVRALVASALMPQLRVLDLRQNRAVGDHAVRALAAASSAAGLHTLDLSHTNVTAHGVGDLFGSACLTGLRELDVGAFNAYGPGELADRLVESPVRGNLTALGLGNHLMGPGLLWRLLAVSGRERLARLDLSGCGLDARSAEPIAAVPGGRLAVLNLNRNRLGPLGLQALAESPRLASLTDLRLAWNDVKDTGAKALAASPHLARLRVLDLAHNHIGGPGIQALAASPNLAGLRELDLSANYVNLVSVEALAASPHLSALRVLKLRDNHLGHEAAAVLSASPHLSRRLRVEFAPTAADAGPPHLPVLAGYGRRA